VTRTVDLGPDPFEEDQGPVPAGDQIASGMSGIYGLFAKTLVGYLVALGKKGLDTLSA
jgi:hypothetical protein